ncbi:MAG TPA: TolC family protein [Candidatus Krumholzibacteria bacterium]|nr:TolC family protein [Candidatus Krumholzibacteria bacterium]HRY40185.1 TolC family protein [Candidatus Krumholzibacteria bacterium]
MEAVGTLAPADSLAAAPDYAQALATAFTHRPELAAIGHELALRADLVKIYSADTKPRLDLLGAYGHREYEIDGQSVDGPYWSASLALSFPIFDGLRTRGRVAQARSDLRSAQIDASQLRDRIALEVRTAVNAVNEAREIEGALAGTVEQAQRLLRMAEDGYSLGVKTLLDVEDAQLNLLSAAGHLAQARRDRMVAEVALEQVQGTLR